MIEDIGQASPTQQLIRHLQCYETLLILDNFERLLAGRALLIQLVQQTPVKLLVTSRLRLGLQMEQVIPVRGLPTPKSLALSDALSDPLSLPDEASSVQLFVERAGRTSMSFSLTRANQADVLAICRAVEGLPLAIELAATLADRCSCAEILGAIRQGIDSLTQPALDREARHHSMRAVFEYSWALLSPRLATILAGCIVFQGGFTAEAAAVLGATPDDLKALCDSSLLSRDPLERYQIHELLRQFAEEKFSPDSAHTIRDSHARWYLQPFCAQPSPTYWHTCPDVLMNALSQDLLNIRAAVSWVLQTEQWTTLTQAIDGLGFFIDRKGLATITSAILEHARTILTTSAQISTFAQRNILWSRLSRWRAYHLLEIGQHDLAVSEARAALQAAHEAQDAPLIASARLLLGRALLYLGDYPQADQVWREGLAMCRAPEMASYQGQFLSNLGQVCLRLGQFEAAQQYLTAAARTMQGASDPTADAQIRLNRGICYLFTGEYGPALAQLAAPDTRSLVAGHARLVADLDNRLALLYLALGDFAAAQVTLRRVAEHAARLQHTELHIFALTSQTRLNYALGDYDATLTTAEMALPVCRAYRPPYPLATVQTFAGHAYLALGNLEQAKAQYEAALRTWHGHEYLSQRAERLAAVSGLAEVALARNDLLQAAAIVAEAAASLGAAYTFQPAHNEPLRIYLTCYRTWVAVGDRRATEILAATAAILQQQAAGIPDAALRHHFLRDVAVNREIRQLAANTLSN